MVQYNPKDWITFIFRFHKADTFRQLFTMMIFIALYSGIICYLEVSYFNLPEESHVKNISIMHGMLGFVISLLLAYRTNTAYERWWEGRKLWGSLVNNSRNLAIKLSAILKDEHDKKYLRYLIPTYASILSKHLSNEEVGQLLYENVELKINHQKHKPNQVAQVIFHKINDLHQSGKISGEQLIILNSELQSFTEICGACERIKNTPIPFSYNIFLKKIIFLYVITIPFAFGPDFKYATILISMIVLYVFASIELIAEEIEDPFGEDDNDLPLDQICNNIKTNLTEFIKK